MKGSGFVDNPYSQPDTTKIKVAVTGETHLF